MKKDEVLSLVMGREAELSLIGERREAGMELTESELHPGRYEEIYLGDGAYAYLSVTRDIVLYTSDGISETNRVVLEPEVLSNFLEWITSLAEKDA